MNYDEDDYTDYFYERLELVATETELQSEIKRLMGQLQNMSGEANYIKQGYFQLGSACYALTTELMMAIGDPTDTESAERAKKHAKEWMKHWDNAMEMKMKADQAQQAAQQPQILQPPEKKLVVIGPNGETPA